MNEYKSPLKEWRKEHGLSLRQLTAMTGVSANVINQFERYGNITAFTLNRLADGLGVTTDWLLGRTKQ